jgi:hypothetical protein
MITSRGQPHVKAPAPAVASWSLAGWPLSLSIGLIAALLYLANGREIGAFDTIPTTMLPLTILRGEGLHLDRFGPILRGPSGRLPVFVTWSRGRIISRYPIGPAVMALPLVAPQAWFLDAVEPGWDRDPARAYRECRRMGKRAAAIIAALVAVFLHRLLVGLGLVAVAVPAVLACALGSNMWSVAGQALWQHGPAALWLTLSLVVLQPAAISRSRILAAGLAAAALVAVRPLDLVFALAVLAWVAWHHTRLLACFLAGPVLLGLALIAYNLWFFGTVIGGQGQLEQLHPELHGMSGPWSGDLRAGMAGTLFSPNRGLFVFSPWVFLSLLSAPASVRMLSSGSPVRWLLLALVPYLLLLSKYAVWWGGGSFGPRYWTETFPLFAVLLACGLDWSRTRLRVLLALFAFSIAFSMGVQAIGAFCYPSTWNFYPTDIDLDHARLWDWRDTEVSRCLVESLGGPVPLRVPGR